MNELSDRELATVLAALRYWQRMKAGNYRVDGPEAIYFTDDRPLTLQQIDGLCARLNTGGAK